MQNLEDMTKTKGKTVNKDLTIEKDKLEEDLKQFGYLLPTNEEELEEFERIYGKTQVMFPEHLKNPSFLNSRTSSTQLKKHPVSSKKVTTEKKPVQKTIAKKRSTKSDYFKKLVLAAEIANQLHEEPTFGHVKFVKVYFLCDQVCNMRLSSQYGRHAAGPLDGKQMRVFDAQFKKKRWFTVTETQYGYRYHPDENIEEYKTYYSRYFKNELDGIERIINLFRKHRSDFCEIVATIFFIWNDFISKHKLINNASLIKDFYAWDEKKKRFSEDQITHAIDWMNENQIVPA